MERFVSAGESKIVSVDIVSAGESKIESVDIATENDIDTAGKSKMDMAAVDSYVEEALVLVACLSPQ